MSEKYKYIKIPLFALLVLSVVLLLSVLIKPFGDTTAGMEKVDKVMIDVKSEKENTIDVVILGDSEAYRSFTPLQIYQDYGFTAYVAASPSQKSYQSLDMFKTVLKTQKPKLCILETNLLFREYSAVAAIVPKFERIFPIFKYHNVWKSVFDSDYTYKEVMKKSFKGYRYSDVIKPSTIKYYMTPSTEAANISAENELYFKKIIQLCRIENISLLLVSSPSIENWNYDKHNGVAKLAKKYDIPYIDLNTESSVEIDWKTDTYDRGDHLNYYGAQKATAFLGEYLNAHYTLTDHRNDEACDSWNKALKSYLKKVG